MKLPNNALTKTLQTLPKDFIYFTACKIILALLVFLSVGALFVFAAIIPLHMYNAPWWAVVAGGWGGWFFFLSIFLVAYFVLQSRYRTKLELLINLANKQIFASLGIFAFNNVLRKLHLKKSR